MEIFYFSNSVYKSQFFKDSKSCRKRIRTKEKPSKQLIQVYADDLISLLLLYRLSLPPFMIEFNISYEK